MAICPKFLGSLSTNDAEGMSCTQQFSLCSAVGRYENMGGGTQQIRAWIFWKINSHVPLNLLLTRETETKKKFSLCSAIGRYEDMGERACWWGGHNELDSGFSENKFSCSVETEKKKRSNFTKIQFLIYKIAKCQMAFLCKL